MLPGLPVGDIHQGWCRRQHECRRVITGASRAPAFRSTRRPLSPSSPLSPALFKIHPAMRTSPCDVSLMATLIKHTLTAAHSTSWHPSSCTRPESSTAAPHTPSPSPCSSPVCFSVADPKEHILALHGLASVATSMAPHEPRATTRDVPDKILRVSTCFKIMFCQLTDGLRDLHVGCPSPRWLLARVFIGAPGR